MWLINLALRRPITILVAVIGIALGSGLALKRMPVDIFPDLNLPIVYVAQPYGGMDPSQMEGYLAHYYEYHFLYINGIEHVESKSIQNLSLLKLFFHPGTDMAQALAQVVAYVERSRAFMPPGTVPPFIVRLDAGGVPVGQLVFSSETRSLGEIGDLALNRVRPMFSTLPGVSAPPPFGVNQRTVVIRVDPERLRAYQMSPEEVVKAVAAGNTILPAGNVRIGDINRLAPMNSVVTDIQELAAIPIRSGAGPAVYLRDIGTVHNSTDILTSFALVNGRRAVYIPVTKRADASTLDVVDRVKAELPRMRALVPDDIRISFEFDQSPAVTASIRGLALEGALGALLSGLMVLLFLRDLRSSLIVVLTIPLSLLGALVALWLTGQTVNMMTLGGLALAVGVLVDEATVVIENIHTRLARGEPKSRAVLEAARETTMPRLLAALSVMAVFLPAFFMTGVARALFVPLSLAVAFAMLASFVLSTSLVPVLAVWMLREKRHAGPTLFGRFQRAYAALMGGILRVRWLAVPVYLAAVGGLVWHFGGRLGTDIFPPADTGQFQFRLRAPTGTRVERTETITLKALEAVREEAGAENVAITLAFVGTQPPSYPINSIHLFTSGPHEALIRVALRQGATIPLEDLRERLRRKLPQVLPPGSTISFEPGDIVSQIMNFGSPTPIEVAVSGPSLPASRAFAGKIKAEMETIAALRDLQYGQPLDYPILDIRVDRERAGQLGVTVQQVGRAVVAATSSSRFVQPIYWRDPASGISFQVQVEIPQARMSSLEDVESVPVMADGTGGALLRDVAQLKYGTMPGEFDRYNMQRTITLTANISGSDLGNVAREVEAAIKRAGDPPRGVTVTVRGQVQPMKQTLDGFQTGLLIAIGVIFLLLAANFQSFKLSFAVILVVPAIVAGVVVGLGLTGTTINVQSFMGAIMAIGVGVANAILLVTFAEKARREGRTAVDAAVEGATSRLRPILMTTFAMIAGMIPMAMAVGEGAEQTAPLGRAVIGGLAASTIAVLLFLPSIFSVVQGRAGRRSASIHPDDATEA